MIEFAPNPTGPMHIGNLRTYAAAYLEAQKTGKHISIRFDENTFIQNAAPYSHYWSTEMLNILQELKMQPNTWYHNRRKIKIEGLPQCVRVINSNKQDWDIAIIKDQIPDKKYMSMVLFSYYVYSKDATQPLDPSREIDINDPPMLPISSFMSPLCWGAYAIRDKSEGQYQWYATPQLANVIGMIARGVDTIVRGIDLLYINEAMEQLYAKYFGYNIPEVLYSSLILSEKTLLTKHLLKENGYGTCRWAINKYGAAKVRDIILDSAATPLSKNIMTLEEIFDE